MTLPGIALDDLRFQRLVDECRLMIAQRCPEWSEVNVSDPGITLIELFAWMMDALSYRINRIPEKLQVALLELVGFRLRPPGAARVELRFRLAEPAKEPTVIPARSEVATERLRRPYIVFQTIERFVIRPVELDVCLLGRMGGPDGFDRRPDGEVEVQDGVALPAGQQQSVFQRLDDSGHPLKPQMGDCFVLGFGTADAESEAPEAARGEPQSIERLLIRLAVECDRAQGLNIKPDAAPVAWEALVQDAAAPAPRWQAVDTLLDTTAGFNLMRGEIELAVPAGLATAQLGGRVGQWLRCIVLPSSGENGFAASPRITKLEAASIGAGVTAEHAEQIVEESLGRSDGVRGRVFRSARSPILPLSPTDGLKVKTGTVVEGWERVVTFADSGPEDRHYLIDEVAGELSFGPAIRESDGSFSYRGAVPAKDAELILSYRHGGGIVGNVPAEVLTHLRQTIPKVSSVTNPGAASGGAESEDMPTLKDRAALGFRTRDRAVTARDYEELCLVAPAGVARVRCMAVDGGGVRLVVLSRPGGGADPALEGLPRPIEPLIPDDASLAHLRAFLEPRRLLGIKLEVVPATFRTVRVVTEVLPVNPLEARVVEAAVKRRLYEFLDPLSGGAVRGSGSGWEFGAALRQDDLKHVVQATAGVDRVQMLRVYEVSERSAVRVDGDLPLTPDELIASGVHLVRAIWTPAS